jgi:hypothetical protein
MQPSIHFKIPAPVLDLKTRNSFKLWACPYSVQDYFEIDRLVEDLAKIYSSACATTWFRLAKTKRPTRVEFRTKVVEFMEHFEYTLSTFPQGPEIDQFRDYARRILRKEIEKVLQGDNKEVERRYKYYVEYN